MPGVVTYCHLWSIISFELLWKVVDEQDVGVVTVCSSLHNEGHGPWMAMLLWTRVHQLMIGPAWVQNSQFITDWRVTCLINWLLGLCPDVMSTDMLGHSTNAVQIRVAGFAIRAPVWKLPCTSLPFKHAIAMFSELSWTQWTRNGLRAGDMLYQIESAPHSSFNSNNFIQQLEADWVRYE